MSGFANTSPIPDDGKRRFVIRTNLYQTGGTNLSTVYEVTTNDEKRTRRRFNPVAKDVTETAAEQFVAENGILDA